MTEMIEKVEPEADRVCHWRHVHLFDNFLRPFVHRTRKLFGPYVEPGSTVLDVGCGRGFASLGLARLVGDEGRVVAADLQPEMLDMVRPRALKAGLSGRISLHQCAPDRIGLEGKFDFVLAFWMIHEVPDLRAFLEEVRSLLAPGGRFFIADPKFHVSRSAFEEMIVDARKTGFTPVARPKVRFSHAVVLEL